MASVFGTLKSLKEFQKTIFKGESIIAKRPEGRWNGCDNIADNLLGGRAAWGGFMNELSFYIGEFHIPPNEIPDILLQHLLMLKVSVNAMEDAELPLRKERPRMGAFIGIDFDFEATDFHLRWNLHNSVKEWKKKYTTGLDFDDEKKTAQWLNSLRETAGKLTLVGTAMDNETVALFMTNLERSEYITAVDLQSTVMRSLPNYKLRVSDFTLECKTYAFVEKAPTPTKKKGRRK